MSMPYCPVWGVGGSREEFTWEISAALWLKDKQGWRDCEAAELRAACDTLACGNSELAMNID